MNEIRYEVLPINGSVSEAVKVVKKICEAYDAELRRENTTLRIEVKRIISE